MERIFNADDINRRFMSIIRKRAMGNGVIVDGKKFNLSKDTNGNTILINLDSLKGGIVDKQTFKKEKDSEEEIYQNSVMNLWLDYEVLQLEPSMQYGYLLGGWYKSTDEELNLILNTIADLTVEEFEGDKIFYRAMISNFINKFEGLEELYQNDNYFIYSCDRNVQGTMSVKNVTCRIEMAELLDSTILNHLGRIEIEESKRVIKPKKWTTFASYSISYNDGSWTCTSTTGNDGNKYYDYKAHNFWFAA